MNDLYTTYEKFRDCELDRCFPGIRRELPRIFAVCRGSGPGKHLKYPTARNRGGEPMVMP
jgi:hypothetical protein